MVGFWAAQDRWADGVDFDAFDGSGLSVQIFMTGASVSIVSTFGPLERHKRRHFEGDLGPILAHFWADRDRLADGVHFDGSVPS